MQAVLAKILAVSKTQSRSYSLYIDIDSRSTFALTIMSVVDSHCYFGMSLMLMMQFDAFEDTPIKMALQESSHLHPTSFPLVAHMKWMVCKGFKHQYLKYIYMYIQYMIHMYTVYTSIPS